MHAPEVKAAQEFKRCRAEVKGVNNPTWMAHAPSSAVYSSAVYCDLGPRQYLFGDNAA